MMEKEAPLSEQPTPWTFPTSKMEGLNNICPLEFQVKIAVGHWLLCITEFFFSKREYYSGYAVPVSPLYTGSM